MQMEFINVSGGHNWNYIDDINFVHSFYGVHTYTHTICQKTLYTEIKNVKCQVHSRIPTIKSLHIFFIFVHI